MGSRRAGTSSTNQYEQELFDTFCQKVVTLCLSVFKNATFAVSRLKGGACNRITTITVTSVHPRKLSLAWLRSLTLSRKGRIQVQGPTKYISRTPRKKRPNEDDKSRFDAVTLAFAYRVLLHFVPRIVQVDLESANAIERPYTIQDRLPGHNLAHVWELLTAFQRERTLDEIVRIMKTLHEVQYRMPGYIADTNDPSHVSGTDNIKLSIYKLNVGYDRLQCDETPRTMPAVLQSTLEFMSEQAERWERVNAFLDLPNVTRWRQFKIIAQSLHDIGFIPDTDKFYFCHLDLFPRNILIQTTKDSGLSTTGVVDWDADYAHFCPKFVAYRAPFWLWLEPGQDGYDETMASLDPKSPHLLRLKRRWEEQASDELKRYAYTPEYMVARSLCSVLSRGIGWPNISRQARTVVACWQALHYGPRLDAT